MTFGSLFSGCGGIDKALHDAGMQSAWQVEIDRDANKVLEARFPEVKRFTDVREITCRKKLCKVQKAQATRSVSQTKERPDGSSFVVQGVLPSKDSHSCTDARAEAAMEHSDSIQDDSRAIQQDDGGPRQNMRDLQSTDGTNLHRPRPQNRKGSGSALPSVQCEVIGDRGRDISGCRNEVSPVELIVAGFPCQDLSVAGKRAGLGGERSGLFFEITRIIKEMRAATNGQYPAFALLENVPGLLSSNGGRDFAVVLRELAESGAMDIAWAILDAQWFGVPQRRRRVFIVADFRGQCAAEILSIPYGMRGHPAPSREARPRVAASLTGGSASGSGINRPGRRREDDVNLVSTLNASMKKGKNGQDVGALVAACLNSGGNNGGFRTEPGEHLIAHTLRSEGHDASEDGTGRGVPLIAFNHQAGGSKAMLGISSERVTALGATQTPAVAFAIQERAVSENMAAGPQGKGYQADVGFTLEARHHQQSVASPQTGVRRLTPTECLRLQGLPDDWLDGCGLSDSAKYRLIGNSVAVPVVNWIAQRILTTEAR